MRIDDFCKILRLNADEVPLLTQDINIFELDWKAANKYDPITHPLSIEKDGEDAWSEVFDYFRGTRSLSENAPRKRTAYQRLEKV